MDYGLAIILLYWICSICIAMKVIGPTDYCEHEHFKARCEDGEAVLMQSATYGRLALGRCIEQSFGYIGCSFSVLHIMDAYCSGQNSCSVAAINSDLLAAKKAAKVCPGLSGYLVASYTCVKITDQKSPCSDKAFIPIQDTEGYLSSQWTTETGHGNSHCPWKLTFRGHIVNVTLYKFCKINDNALLSPTSSLCYEVGKIKDGKDSKNIMACGTDPREKVVHISHSGDIEIAFTEKAILESLGRFFLHYKASKCALPQIPDDSYMLYKADTIIVKCNFSDTEWRISCGEAITWSQHGYLCPGHRKLQTWKLDDIFDPDTISVGLVITAAVGITIVICSGGFLVYLVYFYCKRCQQHIALAKAIQEKDYHEEGEKQPMTQPESDLKYRDNTIRSNATSSDTSSLDKRTISWPIRSSLIHSSHADPIQQFGDEHETESVSVGDEILNIDIQSEGNSL